MNRFSLSHLADHAVTSGLASTVGQDCTTTARLLAYLAEADARRLYVSLGYASMYLYCVRELHMSEDVAFKRIHVARIARKFSAIFDAVAEGQQGLSAVLMLGPHLAAESAGELLAAAAHQSNAEIELLLAERFPQPDVPTLVQGMAEATRAASPSHSGLAVRPLQNETRASGLGLEPDAPRPKLAPLSPGRFAVQVTLDQDEYQDLRRAQELLGHMLPSGDAARVIGRALRVLVATLEKQKFARTDTKTGAPRPRRGTVAGRTIPAQVRRMVAERDGGRCTFVGTNGRRCGERKLLETARALMAYLGLVPSEHSSGERQRRGSITKAGNIHVRRLLIEAAWHYRHRPHVGPILRRRQSGQPRGIIAIADRAQDRLSQRFRALITRGKPPQKAVVAVARELVGFVWAALHPATQREPLRS